MNREAPGSKVAPIHLRPVRRNRQNSYKRRVKRSQFRRLGCIEGLERLWAESAFAGGRSKQPYTQLDRGLRPKTIFNGWVGLAPSRGPVDG